MSKYTSNRAGKERTAALLLLFLICSSEAYKILVFFPNASKSHDILGMGLVKALIRQGHEVTYTAIYPTNKIIKGLTELDFSEQQVAMPDIPLSDLLSMQMDLGKIRQIFDSVLTLALENKDFQRLVHDKTQKFDAVIGEWLFTSVLVGLGPVFDCPFIMSSSVGMHLSLDLIFDQVQSPAVQPYFMNGFSTPMSFYERIINTITFGAILKMNYFEDIPYYNRMHEKYIKPAAKVRGVSVPDFEDCLNDVAFLLVNSHPSLGEAQHLPPNAVEIGGYHIDDDPPPLSEKLRVIMDNAKHGVIYFSLGSVAKSKEIPAELKAGILKIFAGLKETVLWKFEEDLPGLPPNVHIQNWMPQQSILAHNNTKLFITHGGLLSSTEAIHYGVPLLGIPVAADQPMNVARAVHNGYARQAKIFHDGIDDLEKEIHEMLTNSKYAEKAKHLSSLYHDRPMKPADAFVYWTEHVIRTGGAHHLRSAARLVPAYQRYLLDILGLLAILIITVVYLINKVIKCLFSKKCKTKKVKIN